MLPWTKGPCLSHPVQVAGKHLAKTQSLNNTFRDKFKQDRLRAVSSKRGQLGPRNQIIGNAKSNSDEISPRLMSHSDPDNKIGRIQFK